MAMKADQVHTEQLHQQRLHSLCRVCGRRSIKRNEAASDSTKCCYHTRVIKQVHGLNIEEDVDTKHPKTMCRSCYGRMKRIEAMPSSEKMQHNARADLEFSKLIWTEFNANLSVLGCSVCYHHQQLGRGGRPKTGACGKKIQPTIKEKTGCSGGVGSVTQKSDNDHEDVSTLSENELNFCTPMAASTPKKQCSAQTSPIKSASWTSIEQRDVSPKQCSFKGVQAATSQLYWLHSPPSCCHPPPPREQCGSLVRQRRRLKPKAVPSVFHRVEPLSVPTQNRKSRAEKRPARLREIETKKRKVHTDAESGVKASQSTTSVPLIPNIVAPLKLPATSNEASRTLAFSNAERQTVQTSEQKKTSEPVHQRLLAFRVPVNSELYRKIKTADLRASGRAQEALAQEALQHFSMPITAATETEREPEESAGNSAPSVDVGRVKREPEECAADSTPGFHGTPRTPSFCGNGTPSVCGTPGFHEVQLKFEPEECATESIPGFHGTPRTPSLCGKGTPSVCGTPDFDEVQVKFEPEEYATDSTQHFQVVQVRSDFEPAESAADTDTPHFDVVQVKTEPTESATESTSSSDLVQVKLEPEESVTERTSSFDVVQVKTEPTESATESTSSSDVVQVKLEPEESVTERTSSFDVVQVKTESVESATESTSGFDAVQVKLEPEESAAENAPNVHVVQVNSEPAEVMEGEANTKHNVTMTCDTNNTFSHETASSGVDVNIKCEPEESVADTFEIEIA